MVLTNIQIMTHVGITTAANRNAIIADFQSDDLDGLQHLTDDDVKDLCSSYAKRTDGDFPIILTPTQRKRFLALTLFVKDSVRAQVVPSFPNSATAAELRATLDEALQREKTRKEQKKVGESFHDTEFTHRLKSQAQWEKFNEELLSTLTMIIGAQGAPIVYVVREDENEFFDQAIDYDDAINQALTLGGAEFKVDARTVHQIILKNVHEDSDAYTYIKPLLRHQDGRRDHLALKDRYASEATKQALINAAKATLANLRYKSERSFSFEKFSSKLQKAYDDLELNGRPVHNSDIVDELWPRIQASELNTFISTLKVEFSRAPTRDYKLLLQDIAAEIATRKGTTPVDRRGINAIYTKDGSCPQTGVHTSDGKIFVGSYPREKWTSDSVKPYHAEITANRNSGEGGGTTRNQKRSVNAVKRQKRKLKALKQQIETVKASVAAISTTAETNEEDASSTGNKAGDSFGGKNSKRSKRG